MFTFTEIQNNQNVSYIGKFVSDGERLSYSTPIQKPNGKNENAPIRALGHIVYFMFVNGELMKIGKAGGRNGFVGRSSTYCAAPHQQDATTRKILKELEQMGEDTIEIYAIQTPPTLTQIVNPLSGNIESVESPTHGFFEAKLTQTYLDEGGELPFCTQLK